jgi:G6PDH family F420-dependent oxidoreductase
VTHRGTHFTVDAAKVFSRPEELPAILISGFGPKAAELAARAGDGYINVQPTADLVTTYRDAGGSGIVQGGMKFCWAESAEDAAKTAYRLWGFEGIGGQSAQELPSWVEFEALAKASSPEQVAERVPCGPDPEPVAQGISKYFEAGFDEVYVSQMGPDQAGGLRFLTEQVLPLIDST